MTICHSMEYWMQSDDDKRDDHHIIKQIYLLKTLLYRRAFIFDCTKYLFIFDRMF